MSEQLLRAAQMEEALLNAELRQTPTFRKLEAVRALIAAYADGAQSPARGPVSPGPLPRQIEKLPTMGITLARAAADYLSRTRHRAQVTEILPVLQAEGHVIGGKRPDGTLSSTLSHSTLFNNVRGKGYGLAEWGASDGPATLHSPAPEKDMPVVLDGQDHAAIDDRMFDWHSDKSATQMHQAVPSDEQTGLSIGGDDGRIKEEVA